MNSHRCWAEIDLAALRHNACATRAFLGPEVALLAVVKANAYGHGVSAVAKALAEEAELFGVANLTEARELRAIVPHPVIILGPALPEERAEIAALGFIPSVSNCEEANDFNRHATDSPVAVNCVIDTGMGRMGFAEKEVIRELRKIAALPSVTIHSISTHLPAADEDPAFTQLQLERFSQLAAQTRAELAGSYRIHVLPSAGVLNFGHTAFDLVRAGLMLYGASPVPHLQKRLKPVMSLKTRVVLLRELPKGSSVSYGRTFVTRHRTRVATLSVGYADGYPRSVSNRNAAVLIRGQSCAVLGRITMDLTMVDATDVREVEVGDEVVLIGPQGEEQILAAEVAEKAGTIAWEIFTGIGSRVARVYV